ncbi:unnamed protein product [Clavelina lepadiformis]|uniref:Cytosol aminopeptidase domain-containing protein n=1 Tax=Clavelina lepadiformis TaxID=159417 RepID=A0ABP0F481_CLALP
MGLPCQVKVTDKLQDDAYDGVVIVTDDLQNLKDELAVFQGPLAAMKEADASVGTGVTIVPMPAPMKRVIFSSTGPLNRDYDDVRRFADAARVGLKRAVKAGCETPLLVTIGNKRFPEAEFASVLGALEGVYVPLEIRESRPEGEKKIKILWIFSKNTSGDFEKKVEAYEGARSLVRDIQGSDPERMAPPRVAEHVTKHFKDSSVEVEVISDCDVIEKNYPCLGAVNRCAKLIPRHNARVVKLSYEGEGPITETIFLVGKGVTYDTGGADVKAGGIMAGMHRDKGGASAVAGFFEALDKLRPKHLKVRGTMSMVRNSIGANCYVADEIITARSGVRVRVGNTDAEGRMAMVDCLCEAKEVAVGEVNPQLYTIATLTGHAIIAMGPGYSIAMDNGPARDVNNAQLLRKAGENIGDMFEISTIRREDYEFHKGKSEYEDVLQSNNFPSSRTPRGHQGPSAFLIITSGLDKHGIDSSKPLKYTHLDIAGSEGAFPGIPTGCPVPALAAKHFQQ